MRAPVRTVAALVAIAACGPNPYFQLAGESNDGGGSSGNVDSSTDATASGSTGEPIPDRPCPVAPAEPVADVCDPWSPLILGRPPNLALTDMLIDVPCGEVTDFSVKRVDETTIEQCDIDCQTCEPAKVFSVDTINKFAEVIPHLPEVGSCTRMWHVAEPSPSTPSEPCKSLAYAFWDVADRQQLRLAFGSGSENPFLGVSGLPIRVKGGPTELCGAAGLMGYCEEGAKVEQLAVDVGGCKFAARQGELWTDIPLGALGYDFTFRAFTCVAGEDTTRQLAWYLRRTQP